MQIVILNQYALPAGSAGITRHGDLGAELVRRGHGVTVIASSFDYLKRRPGTSIEVGRTGGVRFALLQTGNYTANDSRRVRSMGRYAAAALWSAVRLRPRPDVIIGSSPHLLAALSASLIARLTRRPWVFEVRDFWPSALVDLGAIPRGGRVQAGLERLERQLYSDAQAIVTVPPNGRLRLDELGVDSTKCVHIPNATALVAQSGSGIAPSIVQVLDELRDMFLIIYAGALGVTHDLDSVLAALAQLRMDRPHAYERVALLLVGDGVARGRIVQSARDMQLENVRFHAAIEKAEIPPLLDRADACLMQAGASDYFKYGLSPNKLFDYFAAGKPVLISSAYPTIVDEAHAGLRFEPGDPAALAEAIVRMMELAPEERDRMGERGRQLVQMRYSIPRIADQYEDLLREVVRTGQRR